MRDFGWRFGAAPLRNGGDAKIRGVESDVRTGRSAGPREERGDAEPAASRWLGGLSALALVLLSGVCSAATLTVHKAERRLVFEDRGERRELRVGLGFAPVGAKEAAGDGKTPEGEYFVTHRNPKSAYFRSLGISYPNERDARRGLAAGRITRRQYRAIGAAERARRLPPQDTPLGGTIFLHGRGAGSDWTLGCIALEDDDMAFLFEHVGPGDRITILP
jgi:hypothetical protein